MRTFATEGIVLKRSNAGEADRIVTLFTRDYGKIACVAKGVRKTTSSKRSALEPGMYSKIFCAEGHGLPILTQAQIIEDFPESRKSLHTTRSLSQVLEIFDTVMVEEETQDGVFDVAVEILRTLNNSESSHRGEIIEMLKDIMGTLGFQDIDDTKFESVSEYVEFLSERKMHSFAFLTVKK